jgi:hypothetical protein
MWVDPDETHQVAVEWYQSCFVLRMSRVQISAPRSAFLAEVLPGFLQSLKANAVTVP